MAIVIVVKPFATAAGQFSDSFDAWVEGNHLCTSSAPFLDGARKLLADGMPANTEIVMVHADNPDVECLRSTVGYAAGLSVNEGNNPPKFGKWRLCPILDRGRSHCGEAAHSKKSPPLSPPT